MVSACSTRRQTGDTDSFQLVILLTVQLDSQGTFVLCEARILWYSADRTSSRKLRDTTKICDKAPQAAILPQTLQVLLHVSRVAIADYTSPFFAHIASRMA